MSAFLLVALAAQAAGAVLGFLLARSRPEWAARAAAGGAALGAVAGLLPTTAVVLTGEAVSLRLPWSLVAGEFPIDFHLAVDPLSAVFLLAILPLSALTSLYGVESLSSHAGHGGSRSQGAAHLFFNLLVAAMVLVVTARNAVLFLLAWEVMALSSFFLIAYDHEREEVREAGRIYLLATHLGTAFLFVLFAVLGGCARSYDFDDFAALGGLSSGLAGALFLLAVVGFGSKAGLVPFHVWLPHAYPAAPSHVSALLSGAMSKTGIYGLCRILLFLGPPGGWWGYVLLGLGLASALVGVLFALAQQDLKRLLAYSSVENLGLVAMGLGLGLLGRSAGLPVLAALGFAAALVHCVNHAFMKGLLFLGAGAVVSATGTRRLDRLGGLLQRMPWTGALFCLGAAAMAGIPPLNGFVSEWLLLSALFEAALRHPIIPAFVCLVGVPGLAAVAGLAAACFAKGFGIAFCGQARGEAAAGARECGPGMRRPMVVLAGACATLGLLPWLGVGLVFPAVAQLEAAPGLSSDWLSPALAQLRAVGLLLTVLLAALVGLVALRKRLLAGRDVREAGTWGCGFTLPTPRMQYSGSSFSRPLGLLTRVVLGLRSRSTPPVGYFPSQAAFASSTTDLAEARLYTPLFAWVGRRVEALRWLQQGRIQLYLLYIFVTLVALLLWQAIA
ncbi:MAG: hypothetical protein HYZ53_26030 [Planctomycetes bacterium]|nr:hypothetical protein [Planctomycetota bacterium]